MDALLLDEEDRAYLKDPTMCGGSMIIKPGGSVIAGPMGSEEGILYAEVDLEDTVRGKLVHDFAGHYNRADVFQLNVSTVNSSIYHPVRAPSPVPRQLPRRPRDRRPGLP